MSEILHWLGLSLVVGGLVVECGALVGTKYSSLARCLPYLVVGGLLFYVGVVALVASKFF